MTVSSANKPILVSASMDATIRIWDIATQRQLEALQYKDSQINDICVTPDGAQCCVAASQNVRMYDLHCPTSQGLHTFNVHEKNVTAVGFQSHGEWMYTGGEDCMAKIWDMRMNQLNCQRIFQLPSPIHSVALHPNQVELIVADSTGAIYLWDLRSDRDDSLVTEVDMSEYIVHVNVDRTGRQCAAVTNRGQLFLWDVSHTGMMLPVVDALSSMSLSPSNIPPLKPAPVPQHNSDDRFAIHDPSAAMQPAPPHVVPDRSELIAAALQTTVNAGEQQCGEPSDAGDDGTTPLAAKMVEQQNPQANLQQLDARAHQAPLMQSELAPLNIPPGYQFLPVQQQQQALTLTSSARPYAKIRAHRTFALKCRFRPDGLAIATTSADQTTKLWSVQSSKLLNTYTVPGNKWVWDCAFTNDSRYMITGTSDGLLRMWDVDNVDVVRIYQGHSMGITAMTIYDVF